MSYYANVKALINSHSDAEDTFRFSTILPILYDVNIFLFLVKLAKFFSLYMLPVFLCFR